jgi:hypothetical protein
MEYRTVTIDLDTARELDRLVTEIKNQARGLIHDKISKPKEAGDRIWALADKMDANIRNLILPFNSDDLAASST